MFWYKNKHKDYSLLIFSSIAFLIILSVVFILVIFLNKVNDLREPVKNEIQNYLPAEIMSSSVAEKYSKDMVELRNNVELAEDVSTMFGLVEETFFSVKVPKEMLDNHLQTFLQINSLKGKKGTSEDVLILLDKLIAKINLYYEKDIN